jgi:hypothetical protein
LAIFWTEKIIPWRLRTGNPPAFMDEIVSSA